MYFMLKPHMKDLPPTPLYVNLTLVCDVKRAADEMMFQRKLWMSALLNRQ
uniref:Uncharacterized protein n=1 Tax=Anguilla anguilla TaxID=7936 RepID=A0A0E9TP06_ANGAN